MTTRIVSVVRLLVALLPAPASAAPGIQEVLTPAQYFECQIAARQATVDGLEERIRVVGRSGVGEAEKRAAGDIARHRATQAMYACGKQDGATLGAYAHRHADELQAWLNDNPQVKARLDALGQRVVGLSAQMQPGSPPARP